jgi:GGDEF domain-containing protein
MDKGEAEKEIIFPGKLDIVTGLPNRTQLKRKVEFMLKKAKESKKMAGIIFIDIDSLKQ